MRTYSELITIPTFEDRLQYLMLDGEVGKDTFGFDRYLNQIFYQRNHLWKEVRNQVIIRDMGCDLAVEGNEIASKIIIHHMNPITSQDILHQESILLDPEYLICTSMRTHNAIHYGLRESNNRLPLDRTPNDTCPWKH